MDKIRCVVERITYQNEENGYSVIKVRVKNYKSLVTVVGNLFDINVGTVLLVEGKWIVDSKYGQQFSASNWEETLPATALGIEKYLGSGLIKGIGSTYAKKIVAKFGADTLQIIEDEPNRLIEVDGIGEKRVSLIKRGWLQQKEIKNVMLFLKEHDVSTTHAARIYKAYGNDSIKIVEENPYRLANDIWGIGFKTADDLAQKMGYGLERFERCRSGLFYALNNLSDEGHCFAFHNQLVEKAAELLSVEENILFMTLDEMTRLSDIIKDNHAFYLPPFFHSEVGVARKIKELISAKRDKEISNADTVIKKIQDNGAIKYDDIQINAMKTAAQSKMMVLTGGPGTGKTTTTLGIISLFNSCGMKVLLAAPTGRAAKRMSDTTGMEAKTIHRLLEYKPPEGYKRNEDNPLDADVLICDECSMIDIVLMYNLLKALPSKMTLILVGDIDQLPSVKAGNVLRDIIKSGSIPVVKLERIFRQAMGSKIITNAHRINHGEFPLLKQEKNSDFFFMEAEEPEDIFPLVINLCKTRLPKYYKINPIKDIQILTPMQRGVVGAVNLNVSLQSALNPNSLCLKHGGMEYRLHDKVMQIRNNYDKEVFNGDIGVIDSINTEDRSLSVNYGGRVVEYEISELDELVLAYATTVHKAQGSEFPIVIFPLLMSHFIMLQRNLLYTGITRAKKVLILIGSKKAIACALNNDKVEERNTRLAQRLIK